MGQSRECRRRLHIRIEGRVQGVGYRAWLEAVATGAGLAGWVRNRRDGAVEAVLIGPGAVVEEVEEQCRTGPRMARVSRVLIIEDGDSLECAEEFAVLATA